MFGGDAPEDLGPRTFDLYLKWGGPTKELLTDLHDFNVSAIHSGAERATDHIALAFLWKAEPWRDVSSLLDQLVIRPQAISEVGEFLARSAADHPDSIPPAIEYWQAVLNRQLGPEALGGLGWFSMAEPLDDEVWLPLMARTVEMANGAIEWQGATAERATPHASNPDALSLVTGLLSRETDAWEITQVAEAGLRLLRESLGRVDEPIRKRLRDRLIETEFFEAADID
jgi:hypothetical protein